MSSSGPFLPVRSIVPEARSNRSTCPRRRTLARRSPAGNRNRSRSDGRGEGAAISTRTVGPARVIVYESRPKLVCRRRTSTRFPGSSQERGATHVAFSARDRGAVDAFYEAAMAAGGKDNGAPGLRPQYHETYYAAYVHDADGNNIEAVCHKPE